MSPQSDILETDPSVEVCTLEEGELAISPKHVDHIDDEDDNDSKKKSFVPIGDIFCYCKPTPINGPADLCRRTWTWLKINRPQILSGITVALAQVPEAVSFSFVAGVDPAVGLQSAWIMGICTSLFGGRPGMVAGATGAVAVVLTTLIKEHGVGYMFYAIMLAGLLQMLFGLLKLGSIVRLIPHPVMVGFCNGLGIVIGVAQFNIFKEDKLYGEHDASDGHRNLSAMFGAFGPFTDQSKQWVDTKMGLWMTFIIFVTLATYMIFAKFKLHFIPGSLAGIIVGTLAEWFIVRPIGAYTNTVSDLASVNGSFPSPIWFDSQYNSDIPPFNFETLGIVLPTAITAGSIGLLESLLTLNIIDELTNTKGAPNREAFGQGLGQFLSGFFGGMGGCTTIGQSLMNIHSGGFTRLSSSVAACFMLLIILVVGPLIDKIPVASLAGVMFIVTYYTIEWSSGAIFFASMLPEKIRKRYGWDSKIKRSDVFVMLIVVAVTLIFDLAIAVAVGVLVACIVFAWDAGTKLHLDRMVKSDGELVVYTITGPVFFGSVQPLMDLFPDAAADPKKVEVFLEDAEIFDWSGMVAIKALHERFDRVGAEVRFRSLTVGSKRLMMKSQKLWEEVKVVEPENLDFEEDPRITPHMQGENREG
mmetsp:Transcript_9621/g.21365  ORF Transcript_9621/g.21365 Transcript_9621/m.21365 type:complete len:643 (-) Transcript_9621:273-2201(-)|eukprot:CAMPEP_0113311114 /NCGR_PEP_ID=MMETSP0010_2-20120614/8483_1 /TAXON_ID=216773 ORGANISM="Corethron hystrix, Strain 308" /NCGR_SAMPLE_ID=MMETSP0010_2 /ASSEMBLY_ACC=CAM_ASM_000155 /LENGTH=642 /DNA_ID=CAMNT_0000166693 /DNA_START=174 /DNA_END=2102 /DNA_ORIENTATION=+ /assembly_acc=CAM_ASM_000155